VPGQTGRRAERLGHGLLRREPGRERFRRARIAGRGHPLLFGEETIGQQRRTAHCGGESVDEDHIDANRDDHDITLAATAAAGGRYSTVTDFARLRG
jgi:hypothetical protein